MNENGGNDAKIKRVQPQPSPWKGENVGKKLQTWNFSSTYLSPLLAPYQNYTFLGIPSGSFSGSAVLSSSGPIVAVADHTASGTTNDLFASQSGFHRK